MLTRDNFKHETHWRQWIKTQAIDPRLRAVLFFAAWWLFSTRSLPMVVTCLNRTKDENTQAGGHPMSVHLCGRGADIRLHGWGEEIEQAFAVAIQSVFPWCAVIRESDHIHIGIRYEFRSPGFEIA